MKIFIDSANLADIEKCLIRGFAHGITTNPSLLAKEPKTSFDLHIKKIIELIGKYQPGIHLSVEVFSKNQDEILKQAQKFVQEFNYPQISVKVHVGWDELETIKKLAQMGISVNCTACMSVSQAIMAARAGAKYVSLFYGRIRDGGHDPEKAELRDNLKERNVLEDADFDPYHVIRTIRNIFDESGLTTEIIAGSIRGVLDIKHACLAGAHIITIPPKFFPEMMSHFKTDQVVEQFIKDFSEWLS